MEMWDFKGLFSTSVASTSPSMINMTEKSSSENVPKEDVKNVSPLPCIDNKHPIVSNITLEIDIIDFSEDSEESEDKNYPFSEGVESPMCTIDMYQTQISITIDDMEETPDVMSDSCDDFYDSEYSDRFEKLLDVPGEKIIEDGESQTRARKISKYEDSLSKYSKRTRFKKNIICTDQHWRIILCRRNTRNN